MFGRFMPTEGKFFEYFNQHADCAVIIPTIEEKHVTPHTEAFQMVLLHCLVSHPALQKRPTKW